MLLERTGHGTNWPKSRSLIVAYESPQPGKYQITLAKDIVDDIGSNTDKWRAQFGRRRLEIISCEPCYAAENTIQCLLTLDFSASRPSRLSPDGVNADDGLKLSDENARALYSEVASAWRQLTDVRFRLLAFLPLVSGFGYLQLLSPTSPVSTAPKWTRALFAIFAATVTAAIFVYDRRNSELYDDLISRGKHLEHSLGARSGVFLGRLGGRWPIRHDVALFVIYWATILGWVVVLVAVLLGDHNSPIKLADQPPIVQTSTSITR